MTETGSKKQKWIALAALILFVLTSGIYHLSSRKSGTLHDEATPTAAIPSAGPPSIALQKTISSDSHGAPTSTLQTTANGPSVAAGGPTSGLPATTASPSSARPATQNVPTAAPIAAPQGFFSRLFNFGEKTPSNAPTLALPSTPAGPSLAVGTGSPGVPTEPPKLEDKIAAIPAPPADDCLTLTYHRKSGTAAASDEDADAYRKNLIKFQHSNINTKSVCVRVNGTPVHYLSVKGHGDEVIIGAVAGAKAKVTVRYCTGKLTGCAHSTAGAEDCSVPKDEFMEAIGGNTGEGSDPRLGQWDPSAPAAKEADVMARLDGAVKKELETNDDLNGRAPKGDLFKDWISDNGTTACGATQASN